MELLRAFFRRLMGDKQPKEDDESSEGLKPRYRRLWKYTALITATITILPLLFMTLTNYYQYQRVFKDEMIYPVNLMVSNTKRTLEYFLEQHLSALRLIVSEGSFEKLTDQARLAATMRNLKNIYSDFVDLGVIDSKGTQRSYVGPYDLLGKNYKGQEWFYAVSLRGVYVSDVFMGYRNFPHFVIAVKKDLGGDDYYILRATLDIDVFKKHIRSLDLKSSDDAFLINREGILQTPSKMFGKELDRYPWLLPSYSTKPEIMGHTTNEGNRYLLGYGYIEDSPFIFIVIKEPQAMMRNWFRLRSWLIGFFIGSVIIILILILGTSYYLVLRIREADLRRQKVLHNIEYTNKLAAIGRLGAGVAHEINNPLAVINEKAGLMKDLVNLSEDLPHKQKFEQSIASILNSVERCRAITHRLLGFAKHMDVQLGPIDLEALLKEVLGFLGKEAEYRNINIRFHVQKEVTAIVSDRGQLQQVFLNILNNAFEAIKDGGNIDITIEKSGDKSVAVTIADDGEGIPKENLKYIFEPFFTTKKGYGTGLGLSITYGIVKKLGGDIEVTSKVGKGTSFKVTFPTSQYNL